MTDNKIPLGYYERLRNPWNVPERLKKHLCMCKRDGLYLPIGIEEPTNKNHFWVCTACNKLPIYHFFICLECEEPFIRDFRHPKFCVLHPLCWNCITTHPDYCKCVQPRVKELIGITEPYLPKPRVFTAEELESVFDF